MRIFDMIFLLCLKYSIHNKQLLKYNIVSCLHALVLQFSLLCLFYIYFFISNSRTQWYHHFLSHRFLFVFFDICAFFFSSPLKITTTRRP